MNLTDKYSNTTNRKYLFQIVKTPVNRRQSNYQVAIYKWSNSNKKHIFEDHLNQDVYLEMIDDPAMSILGFLDESMATPRDLYQLMRDKGVKYVNDTATAFSYYGDHSAAPSVVFTAEEEANKCIKMLQDMFQDITTS